MANIPYEVSTLLFDFVKVSKDGYAIFDKDDNLIYANYVYRDIFCLSQDPTQKFNFEEMIKHAFNHKHGINIEAQDIEIWLKYVRTVRRKRAFRIFEVDLVDGRWILFSEQELDSGELLVQTKDITRQKVLETQLKDSVSKLHKLALTDELTQLANRRCFVDSVSTELSRCKKNQNFATMLIIDLDHFKNINDFHGHNTGDKALQHVALILKDTLRQYDIVGRIGGEEFAIFLGATDVLVSSEIAERIRHNLESSLFTYEDKSLVITASIGITSRDCDVTFEQLYIEADEALYQAKANGRNRIEIFVPQTD